MWSWSPPSRPPSHTVRADILLCVDGAQAIGSLVYGVAPRASAVGIEALLVVPPCNVIFGSGNKWVTTTKSVLNRHCGIYMLAGPSEVLVIAGGTTDTETVGVNVIAQAKHDVVARTILITTEPGVVVTVKAKLVVQMDTLPEPNHSTTREALHQSFSVLCWDMDE